MASLRSWPSTRFPRTTRCRVAIEERRTVGPLDVSSMGFGTWAWGNRFLWDYTPSMDAELEHVFQLALQSGLDLFDTADSYGTGRLNGRSEELLGQFRRKVKDKTVHVATKFAAYPWRILPGNLVAACRGSLRRLDMTSLSLGQLHWSTAKYAPLQERALRNGLVEMYREGLVQAVGVSNYGPKELTSVHRELNLKGVPLSAAQSQFSLLSYGPEQKDLKAVCDELGIVLIAYSPLALGLLTGKFDDGNYPKGPRGALFRSLLPKVGDVMDLLKVMAKELDKTPAQVAINWCLCKGTIPIPGVKTVSQAEENLGAMGWRLSSAEVTCLDAVASKTQGRMVQNIFQTR